MTVPYRVPEPRPNWCVIECGPAWAEIVLDGVTEDEAKRYAEAKDEPDYGITYRAQEMT